MPVSSGVSQTWTKRVGPDDACATSACTTPEPADSTCTVPGMTAASCPWSSAWISAPDSTQVTISWSLCGWSVKPSPGRSRWSSWQTIGPKPTFSGS